MQITEIAKNKIGELIDGPNEVMFDYKFFLRITAVENEGIQYQTYFDYEPREDDNVYDFEKFHLRIDQDSYGYVANATLDYSEDKGFFMDNVK
jgi:Fe-S cluster assembly iron-binding protein IscA